MIDKILNKYKSAWEVQKQRHSKEFQAWVKKWEIGPGMSDRPYVEDDGTPDGGFEKQYSPLYTGDDGYVRAGWVPLLDRLAADLVAMGWDRQVSQIKEKFGTLRFYADNVTGDMQERIQAAENESAETCEYCGKPGEIRATGWHKTLCDACVNIRATE